MASRTLDVSRYIENLGDPSHGLRAAKVIELRTEHEDDGNDGWAARLPDHIYQAASGPVTTSTYTGLVRLTDVLLGDPNGYYRSLGFLLPTRAITKKQLRRAYSKRRGSNSPWLTYCFKQLLNPEVRAYYDGLPAGHPMMDRYIASALRNQAKKWASQQTHATGEEIDADDYLKREYGIELDANGELVGETDRKVSTDHIVSRSGWPYGFYLWRSRKYDEEVLSEWQRILVRVLSERGLSMQIAVGYCGDTAASHIERVHSGNLVLFLHEDAIPSRELAEAVAANLSSITPVSPPLFNYESEIGMTTSTTTEEPEFDLTQARRGGKQAEEKAAAEKAARDAARQKTEYLTSILQKDGDTVFIRFLMDEPEWPEFHQHGRVPTCPPPEGIPDDQRAKWPKYWFAVCRKSEKANGSTWYPDCYICDHVRKPDGKPISRGLKLWALACIRKEVIGTQEMVAEGRINANQVNRRVGFVDEIVEYPEMKDGKETGRTLRRKRVVVLNFSMKNFFGQFITYANPQVYGTVLDRDYLITRKGDGMDVDYVASPMDVIQVPVKDESGAVVGTEPFDLRNSKYAQRYADHGINLAAIIKRSMSVDNYNRYFDPRVTVKWKNNDDDEDTTGGNKGNSSPGAEPVSSEPSNERLTNMRDRILNQSKPDAEGSATAAPIEPGSVAAPSTSTLVDLS